MSSIILMQLKITISESLPNKNTEICAVHKTEDLDCWVHSGLKNNCMQLVLNYFQVV
jgi:hypothetical protein